MEPLYRCLSVQDVLLDVLTNGPVVSLPEETARQRAIINSNSPARATRRVTMSLGG